MAGLCGWVIGRISFKVRAPAFVMPSRSASPRSIRLVALNWVELTQGPMASTTFPLPAVGVPGWSRFRFSRKPANYYLVLVVGIVCYVLIRRREQLRSAAGRAMIAPRNDERRSPPRSGRR